MDLENMVKKAKIASRKLALIDSKTKNKILLRMADLIEKEKTFINKANKKDIEAGIRKGLNKAMIDRLSLTDKRIQAMADGLRIVAKLKNPVGEIIKKIKRPNGLLINKIRVPIGVIFIIYESRPNVTVDSVGLCFKSGNSVILRGGKESLNSNKALVDILHKAVRQNGCDKECIQFVNDPDRDIVSKLLSMHQYIDLVIPRGGEDLIRLVVNESKIPVIKHYKGICHVYVDKDADLFIAEKVVINAKVQRPGVCNAMETLLIHKDIADKFLPLIADRLRQNKVQLKGCVRTVKIIKNMELAAEEDWSTEYLDLILSIKIVNDVNDAIWHINNYGSMHSDSIITMNKKTAKLFENGVDSACVFINTSTRFSDGGEFGMGAEIGISTDKIHARGPMGLEELTSYKYVVRGNGQIRK